MVTQNVSIAIQPKVVESVRELKFYLGGVIVITIL
jgi:hypothetical protein